jgi:hypothetical protein
MCPTVLKNNFRLVQKAITPFKLNGCSLISPQEKIDWKKVRYHTSDSKHLTVISAFKWTISSEQ